MTWGLSATGFNRKCLPDCLDEIKAAFEAAFSIPAAAMTGETILGQIAGIMAEREAELWEMTEAVYYSAYPDTAEGVSLAYAGSLTGHAPLKERRSTVTATVGTTGGSPVTLPAGRRARVPATLAEFETLAEVTIPAGGTVDVAMQAVEAGPVEAPAGTLTAITTPVSGWDTITNTADAIVGRSAETDSAFRLRRRQELTIAKGGTIAAMEARIRNEVVGVTYCYVRENRESTYVDGLKPHSVHVTVIGGDDQDVAAKIWETKPGGANTNGAENATVIDSGGNPQTVYWDRVTTVRVYLIVNLTTSPSYPTDGDDLVRDLLADFDSTFDHGQDVLNWQLVAALVTVPGVLTVEILQGTAPAPTTSANIVIAGNEKASIAGADITVNS